MTELEILERAKMYMEKLANGINPIDGTAIPDGEAVNNVHISRCFFYVADVLGQVIENGGIAPQKKHSKPLFSLPMEKRKAFAFSDVPITISEIVKRINDLVTGEDMTKLTTTVVTNWLVSIDILVNEINTEGKTGKRPSPQGESLGMSIDNRTGINGPYAVVVYSREAQQFVVDNLDAALEMQRQKTENQGRPWTPGDDQYLQECYKNGVAVKEIAAVLKRNNGAIRARIKKLGMG